MRRVLLSVLVFAWVAGCDGSGVATQQDLPEDPRLRVSLSAERLLRDAKKNFESDRRELLKTSRSNIAGVAQAEHILGRLEGMSDHSQQSPVTIAGHAGRDARGEPYLSVLGLVPSREASRVRLVMSDEKGDIRTILLELHPECKSPDYVVLHYFPTEELTWDAVKEMLASRSGTAIDARGSTRVPFPNDWSAVACAVAIEDQRGRLGNFVPVVRYDVGP